MINRDSNLTQVKSVVADPNLIAKRRAQVIEVATKMFASKGFHGTKIKDVAEAAGVSPGLIYQYFEEKHDILFLAILAVISEKLQRLRRAMEANGSPVERLKAVIAEYIRINSENHHAVILIYREIQCLPRHYIIELQSLEVETNAIIAEAVGDGVKAGVFKRTDKDFVSHVIVTLAQAWATKHWRLKDRGTLEHYIDECTILLLDSLRP
jgi:AcrR family transcriptional regulator